MEAGWIEIGIMVGDILNGFRKLVIYLEMRYLWILFVFVCSFSWGQQILYSPYSIYVPTGTIETISRIIKIDENQIRIESDSGNDLTDVQIIVIQSKEINSSDYINFTVYYCISEDGEYPKPVIIEEYPSFITVIQPMRINPEDGEEYRLVLEQYN